MLTEAQLKAILDVPEADRTPEQKKALADFFTTASAKPADEAKPAKGLMTIEEAFEHPRFKELIEERKTLKAKAEALESTAQAAEKKRLLEENNFKALYETAQGEITNLKPKAEALVEMEKTLTAVLTAQVSDLPEQFRDIVPDGLNVQQKLDWLSKNKAKFMKPEAPELGAGEKGKKKPVEDKSTELDELEKVAAVSLGMTAEDYKKFKDNVSPSA